MIKFYIEFCLSHYHFWWLSLIGCLSQLSDWIPYRFLIKWSDWIQIQHAPLEFILQLILNQQTMTLMVLDKEWTKLLNWIKSNAKPTKAMLGMQTHTKINIKQIKSYIWHAKTNYFIIRVPKTMIRIAICLQNQYKTNQKLYLTCKNQYSLHKNQKNQKNQYFVYYSGLGWL